MILFAATILGFTIVSASCGGDDDTASDDFNESSDPRGNIPTEQLKKVNVVLNGADWAVGKNNFVIGITDANDEPQGGAQATLTFFDVRDTSAEAGRDRPGRAERAGRGEYRRARPRLEKRISTAARTRSRRLLRPHRLPIRRLLGRLRGSDVEGRHERHEQHWLHGRGEASLPRCWPARPKKRQPDEARRCQHQRDRLGQSTERHARREDQRRHHCRKAAGDRLLHARSARPASADR